MKILDREAVESRTQSIGKDLFERVKRASESLWASENWTSRVLNWSTRHEDTRLQLFRFVDVLPTLENDADVIRHLQEYFRGRPDPFSGMLKVGLGLAHTGGLAQKAVVVGLRRGLEQIARTFIAAGTPEEARRAVSAFRRHNQTFTLDVLGEATLSEKEADAYLRRYLELLDALTVEASHWDEIPQIDSAPWGSLPQVNLSVKLTSLHPYFDPADPEESIANVNRRLRPIAEMARDRHAHLHIDVEEYHIKELTFDTFKSLCTEPAFQSYRHMGIVLQAYLKESGRDAKRLIAWAKERGAPITVRLVKGAYWDYETVHARLEGWPVPVYTDKQETDANFEHLTRLFLHHPDAIDLAVGSHNIRSVAHALAVAREMGLPQGTLEFQFLYGMATPLRHALTEMGERVRVYTPYGDLIPGMAYLVRRLLENTSNESFLRKGFVEDQPVEALLADPGYHADADTKSHDPGMDDPDDAQATEGGGKVTALHLQVDGSRNKENGVSNSRTGIEQEPPPHDGNGATNVQPATPNKPLREGPALGPDGFANQPLLDLAMPADRTAFHSALQGIKENRLGRDFPLLIGDEEVESGEWIVSINPSLPSQVVGRVAQARRVDAVRAVEAAAQAFTSWRDQPVHDRTDILYRAADIMAERRFELASTMVLEAGKPWREADGDVAEAIDFLRYYATQAPHLMRPLRMGAFKGEVTYLLREPRGVTAVIAPWNFPLAIITGMTAAALATGNTVVVKPAEQTPVIAHHMVCILRDAGVPPGAVHFLPGLGEIVGDALVHHLDVHIIAFTGSRSIGLSILENATHVAPGQRHVKRVVAEMGGKNAIIVDDDADLDEAVAGVVTSAFGYAGQKCSACSRAIILDRAYDAFVERLVESARSLPFGPAEAPETLTGPVINQEAMERITGFIEQGHAEGTPLLIQDVPESLKKTGGYFVPPAIFGDVPNDATIACEEIFGPVLSCMRVGSFDTALEIAQESDYALTGGVFSRSPAHVRQAREAFRVGNLYINRNTTGALVGRQPFGGLRLSGVGFKAGGPDYLLQFLESRTVTENTLRRGFASEDTAGDK